MPVDPVLQQHLIECRDRYLALDGKIDKLGGRLWVLITAVLTMQAAVIAGLIIEVAKGFNHG